MLPRQSGGRGKLVGWGVEWPALVAGMGKLVPGTEEVIAGVEEVIAGVEEMIAGVVAGMGPEEMIAGTG